MRLTVYNRTHRETLSLSAATAVTHTRLLKLETTTKDSQRNSVASKKITVNAITCVLIYSVHVCVGVCKWVYCRSWMLSNYPYGRVYNFIIPTALVYPTHRSSRPAFFASCAHYCCCCYAYCSCILLNIVLKELRTENWKLSLVLRWMWGCCRLKWNKLRFHASNVTHRTAVLYVCAWCILMCVLACGCSGLQILTWWNVKACLAT